MFSALWLLAAAVPSAVAYVVNNGTDCYVYPESLVNDGEPTDDTPSVLQAFQLCGVNGSITMTEGNHFYIDQVMNTTNLENCNVNILGEMEWSTDVPYWLSHSLPVVYANLSTAWLFGGTNVTIRGYSKGLFNGNGQTWYDENMGQGNQPGRPIAITIYNSSNVLVDSMTWTQSQFWNSFVSHSSNVTMSNIFMNSTSDDGNDTVNTDGCDTWNSRDVSFYNWTVTGGDDCISVKGNSTNVYGRNITCYGTGAFPIGSVGQFPETPDYVENVLFEDALLVDASNTAWIKTWQGSGESNAGGSDAGGGGSGYVRNVTWRNMVNVNVNQPIYVTQCIYNSGEADSVCDTSTVQISDITWQNITGTSRYDVAGSIHCSASRPCPGLKFIDVNITSVNASMGLPTPPELYLCANIVGQNATGANSTGIPCNGFAPNNFPQQLTMNY
ncbi:glycoside hydrolase family 28 protein [Viridothelium virens]|uniref:Glycoside hydrolase family 28 protein n=1 Tax=Viridothelium virens TaxID=1048519 RepID=A0A6A6H6D3_VIRVR|nr:glycoside hydrolase family 28 protein [Viridothelium virens]